MRLLRPLLRHSPSHLGRSSPPPPARLPTDANPRPHHFTSADMYQLNELCVFAAAGDDGALYAVLQNDAHPDAADVVGRYGNFDIVLDHCPTISRGFLSSISPHT